MATTRALRGATGADDAESKPVARGRGPGACLRPHPAFFVAFIAFWVLFTAGGVRATPSLLTVSWEKEFGWTRALISGAVSINVLLYGVIGPFAAAAFDLASLRVIATCALVLLCIGMGLTLTMGAAWHLYILVGLALGFGSGTSEWQDWASAGRRGTIAPTDAHHHHHHRPLRLQSRRSPARSL